MKNKHDDIDALLNAAAATLKKKGWNVFVIGGVNVAAGSRLYNYTLEIGFTGKPPEKKKKKITPLKRLKTL